VTAAEERTLGGLERTKICAVNCGICLVFVSLVSIPESTITLIVGGQPIVSTLSASVRSKGPDVQKGVDEHKATAPIVFL